MLTQCNVDPPWSILIARLIYFEEFGGVREAIEREKKIKRWRREKKLRLIESANPGFIDLAEGWFGE